jgi:hypothetical protein
MWFRKPKPDPAATSRGLREQALSIGSADVGVTPSAALAQVWGVLMETGYKTAVASLVVFADGTTSLYFSSGGGVIGAGEHARVRAASDALLTSAEAHVAQFAPVAETPLPAPGRVRFHVRTYNGIVAAEADEQDLGFGEHPLSPVFRAGHGVITELRKFMQ